MTITVGMPFIIYQTRVQYTFCCELTAAPYFRNQLRTELSKGRWNPSNWQFRCSWSLRMLILETSRTITLATSTSFWRNCVKMATMPETSLYNLTCVCGCWLLLALCFSTRLQLQTEHATHWHSAFFSGCHMKVQGRHFITAICYLVFWISLPRANVVEVEILAWFVNSMSCLHLNIWRKDASWHLLRIIFSLRGVFAFLS